MKRYYLANSRTVPGGGSHPIRIGIPVPQEQINDICLCVKGSYEMIPLNRLSLREALLNDKEFNAKELGIVVMTVQDYKALTEKKPSKKNKEEE